MWEEELKEREKMRKKGLTAKELAKEIMEGN